MPQCTCQAALDYLAFALTHALDFPLIRAVACASGICFVTHMLLLYAVRMTVDMTCITLDMTCITVDMTCITLAAAETELNFSWLVCSINA